MDIIPGITRGKKKLIVEHIVTLRGILNKLDKRFLPDLDQWAVGDEPIGDYLKEFEGLPVKVTIEVRLWVGE